MPQLPVARREGSPGFTPVPNIAAPVSQGMEQLGRASYLIQDQADDVQLLQKEGEWKSRLNEFKLGLATDPDYETHADRFRAFADETQKQILSDASPAVQKTLAGHFATTTPDELFSVQAEALKTGVQVQRGAVDALGDVMAHAAALEQDPARVQNIVGTYHQAVDRAVERRVFNPEEASDLHRKFDRTIQFGLALRDARTDPVGTLDHLAERYPLLDAKTMETVFVSAETQRAKAERETAKAQKELTDGALLEYATRAMNNELTPEQLDAGAKRWNFSYTEYQNINNIIKEDGRTNTVVALQVEANIRSGQPVSIGSILANPSLNRDDKRRMMELVSESQKSGHFTKRPDYLQAEKEIRTAVSNKSIFESFDPTEQKTYLYLMQKLWDDTQAGRDPLLTARALIERIPIDEGYGVGIPNLHPNYSTPEDLKKAFDSGQVSRADFDREALMFENMKKKEELAKRAKARKQEKK